MDELDELEVVCDGFIGEEVKHQAFIDFEVVVVDVDHQQADGQFKFDFELFVGEFFEFADGEVVADDDDFFELFCDGF